MLLARTSLGATNPSPHDGGVSPPQSATPGILLVVMDVFDAIRSYRPCLSYGARPVPTEKLMTILSAARLAPSQRNLQPWRFVVVRDDERKRLLAQASNRGKLIAEAPAVIVAFAVEEDIPITIGTYISAYPWTSRWRSTISSSRRRPRGSARAGSSSSTRRRSARFSTFPKGSIRSR